MTLEEARRALGEFVSGRAEALQIFGVMAELFEGGARAALEAAGEVYGPLIGEGEEEEALLRPREFVDSVGEPPPPIVEGVLPVSSVLIVSARPKTGKTFLMLQMAEDVATGGKLFGKWDIVRPGPVVYFCMEGSKYQLKERLVKRGMDARDPDVFFFTGKRDFSTPDGLRWMLSKMEEIQPVLIIVDTAREAFPIGDWNNATEVGRALRPLVNAIQGKNPTLPFPNGCSCVVVHHNNKNTMADAGDKISGSNAFQGLVDGYIILDKKKRLDNGDLQVTAEAEGRIDMPESFILTMDNETEQFRALTSEEADAAHAASQTAAREKRIERVLQALNALENGEGTAAEIARHMSVQVSRANELVREAAKAGRIEDTGRKKTLEGAGKPASVWAVSPNNNYDGTPSYIGGKRNYSSPYKEAEDIEEIE